MTASPILPSPAPEHTTLENDSHDLLDVQRKRQDDGAEYIPERDGEAGCHIYPGEEEKEKKDVSKVSDDNRTAIHVSRLLDSLVYLSRTLVARCFSYYINTPYPPIHTLILLSFSFPSFLPSFDIYCHPPSLRTYHS
ncbi:MAG: hypothetical protein L6R40_007711 [Gallowayella cf. fulva]|nr:MAG: hypothetical protein L6R40_007711 [Xanthomendoza cf. fulva]